MIPTPHDALFKATFQDLGAAADELRLLLPPALSAALDWSTLRLEATNYVHDALHERFSDLLFSVGQAGASPGADEPREVLLYLLFEHQSQPRRLIAFFLLRYMVDTWTGYLRAREEREGKVRQLPAIIPLVLYHGQQRWTVPRNLLDLLALEGPARVAAAPHVPSFEYLLDDLHATPDEALKARPMDAASRLILGAFKRGRGGDWRGFFLVEYRELMDAVAGSPGGVQRLMQVVLSIMEICDIAPEEIEAFLKENPMSESIEKTFVSTADMYRQQGRERARAETSRAILRMQLEERFGSLPAEASERIEQAALDQVDRWLRKLLVASSLDEVFRA